MNIISIILLLWRIIILSCCYGAATTSAASAPIAKPNCTTHCGDVAIPYPFGIGPHKDCYLDEWFQIECRHTNSTTSANYSRPAPFLKSLNLELLSIFPFEDARQSVQVKSPIAFFSCEGKETHQPQNLTGSPFIYSQIENTFIAVGCDLFARVLSDHGPVAGCGSICQQNTDGVYYNCNGTNGCCQINLSTYELTNPSIEIPSKMSDRMEDCKYAFFVEAYWFKYNLTNFQDLKDMYNVPVVLDWILNVHDYGERFRGKTNQSGNHSSPVCSSYRNTMSCACQPGMEGNPCLLQPCQDIDECEGSNECKVGDVCENLFGGYRCYSNITGSRCTHLASDSAALQSATCHPFRTTSDRAFESEIKTIILGVSSSVGLFLLFIGARWVYKIVKKRKTTASKKHFFKRG